MHHPSSQRIRTGTSLFGTRPVSGFRSWEIWKGKSRFLQSAFQTVHLSGIPISLYNVITKGYSWRQLIPKQLICFQPKFQASQEWVMFTGWVGGACLTVLHTPSLAERHSTSFKRRYKGNTQIKRGNTSNPLGRRFEPEQDPRKSVLHEDAGVPTPGLSPPS